MKQFIDALRHLERFGAEDSITVGKIKEAAQVVARYVAEQFDAAIDPLPYGKSEKVLLPRNYAIVKEGDNLADLIMPLRWCDSTAKLTASHLPTRAMSLDFARDVESGWVTEAMNCLEKYQSRIKIDPAVPLSLCIDGDDFPVENYEDIDLNGLALPNLADVPSSELSSVANESRSNGEDDLYIFYLSDRVRLYLINGFLGPQPFISTESLKTFLLGWEHGDEPDAEWLDRWGFNGLSVLDVASPDDKGFFSVWVVANNSQETSEGFFARDDMGVLLDFLSYEEAREFIDEYDEPGTLTIVKA